MQVLKFGGSSVASSANINKVAAIIKEKQQGTRLVVVVSALGGITDLLLARRNETDMRMQAVQLEMDTARLWAQLNFLIPEGAAHADHTK